MNEVIQTIQNDLSIEIDTSEGPVTFPLHLKKLASLLGFVEMGDEAVRRVVERLQATMMEFMPACKGLVESEVEKVLATYQQAYSKGEFDWEVYQQLLLGLQKRRLTEPTPGEIPSEEELAAIIDTFLTYPGMGTEELISLGIVSLRAAFYKDADKLGFPKELVESTVGSMAEILAKGIAARIPAKETTLETIRNTKKNGRVADKIAELLFPDP